MPARTATRLTLAALLVAATSLAAQQPRPVAPVTPAAPQHTQPISDHDLKSTQDQLIKLLRESPTLVTVVEHDPSLLANQDYVRKNNPQLAQFLDIHPEVGLNPDYYLFTHLNTEGGGPDQALERAVWPELQRGSSHDSVLGRLVENLVPFLVFLCLTAAVIWTLRLFVENRRWNRIFKLQTEVHGKLIDRCGSSQELLTYMNTEAGRRFLEAAPLAVNFDGSQSTPRMPSAIARIITPLQVGVVLALLGFGLLVIRHTDPDLEIPLLVFGTLILMPGIGFILSAGLTWLLAGRLGLMPKQSESHAAYENHLAPRERQ
ncbi:MAG TPA: hypothetical protein VIM62_01035 [Acidobacteriaceae bacterium]